MTKAFEWYERGNANTDPFNSFSDYWRGFNNLYFTSDQTDERTKIRRFLQARMTEEQAAHLFSDYPQDIAVLIDAPVEDMRGNGRNTTSYLAEYAGTTHAASKLAALLMIIYQVRCNFEHGQKSPTNDRDLSLCIASGRIIAAVMAKVSVQDIGDKA